MRGDSHSVPLQLKNVLAAMRSDSPQHVPHRDFLHCLDRNCVRRKNRALTQSVSHTDVVYFTTCDNENFVSQLIHSMMLTRCSSPFWTLCNSRWTTKHWLVCNHYCSLFYTFIHVLSMFACLYFSARLLKSRICTRFLWRRTCGVWTAALSRLGAATCSACLCT